MDAASGNVWLVVLGAALAMATTIVVEALKYFFANWNKRKDYKIFVRLELKSLVAGIDRLVNQYGTDQFFRFQEIDELRESAQRANRVREQITLIKNDGKKEQILSAIGDVFNFCSDTKALESTAFVQPTPAAGPAFPALNPWNADVFKNRRQMLALESIDIKRKLQDIVSYLEN